MRIDILASLPASRQYRYLSNKIPHLTIKVSRPSLLEMIKELNNLFAETHRESYTAAVVQ